MNYGKSSTSARRTALQAGRTRSPKRKTKSFSIRGIFLILLVIIIVGLLGGGIIVKRIIDKAPEVTKETLRPSAYTTTAYANDEKTVIGTLVGAGSNRVFKPLDKIPQNLQNAFIAIEDSRFYQHKGVDWKGVARAAFTGLTSGNFSQGGSTITQQLIKNSAFPNFSQETRIESIERKIQELYLATKTEKTIGKNEILENYLNTINLGQNTLGVQSAAQRYFGKNVEDLTLSECATIAAITKSPSGYNPITNPEANAKRREKVLKDMCGQGLISQEEKELALADDVYARIKTANETYLANQSVNSYFLDEVTRALTNDLCKELGYSEAQAHAAIYSGGLKIITTQDVLMQQICDEELNRASNYPAKTEWSVSGAISIIHEDGSQKHYDHNSLAAYVKNKYGVEYGSTFSSSEKAQAMLDEYIATLKKSDKDQVLTNITLAPQPQATIVVMDQYTGHVKAMVGGRGAKTADMSLNRATQSPRQPGSTFKVLSTFVPALDAKNNTLATTIEDAPFKYKDGRYVKNHWSGYRGALTIRYCIQQSANVCSVKKYTEITPKLGMKYLTENFAFTTLDTVNDSGQATALGGLTKGVYNIELTAAYASIANNGVYTEPILYTKVYNHEGIVLLEKKPKTHVAMKDTTAALMTSAMEDVVKSGTGTAARLSGVACAGKTGTTTSNRDFWFSGYTPYLTASVWSGYDDNKPMSSSSSFHKGIWKRVMQRIHDSYKYKEKTFTMPKSITTKTVCKKTGQLATEQCEKYTEYFATGTVPKDTCKTCSPALLPTTPDGATGGTTGNTTGGTTNGNATSNTTQQNSLPNP